MLSLIVFPCYFVRLIVTLYGQGQQQWQRLPSDTLQGLFVKNTQQVGLRACNPRGAIAGAEGWCRELLLFTKGKGSSDVVNLSSGCSARNCTAATAT